MADLTNEQRQLLSDVTKAFPESPALEQAMLQLFEAQNHLKTLGSAMQLSGIKPTDPLSVGVYVDIHTALEAQAHGERTVNLMVMLALNQKIMNVAGDTATIAQAYKTVLDEAIERSAQQNKQEESKQQASQRKQSGGQE